MHKQYTLRSVASKHHNLQQVPPYITHATNSSVSDVSASKVAVSMDRATVLAMFLFAV